LGVWLFVFLLPCSAWAALGQQSKDTTVPVQGGESAHDPARNKEEAPQPLTNDSIVKLVKKGLPEDSIISLINTRSERFSFAADAIAALQKAGVSARIISAMVNRDLRGSTATTAERNVDQDNQATEAAPNQSNSDAVTVAGKGPPTGESLTNDSIVKMVKAGLSDTVIVTTVTTQPGRYSLGADDIIALKKEGVSETVIGAMLTKPAINGTSAPAAPPSAEVTEVGVYFKKGDAWVEAMPEVVNWQTGGVIKSLVTADIVKEDVNGRIDGKASRSSVTTPVEVLVRLPEGTEITEYQLLHLHQHQNSREFRTVTGGVFHQSGGAKRDTLPFEYKKVAVRTYLVSLPNLDAGEYGLLPPGAVLSSHPSAQLGKMYTFHVIE
jgi:hypothetical protein